MNDLAQRLRALASTLEKHARNLDSSAFVKKAMTFSKALTTFEVATADAAAGLTPGMRDLEKIFTGPDKKWLKEPVMKKLFSEVLETKLPAGEKAGALQKKFLKLVKERGVGEPALSSALAAVAKARAAAEPPPKDKDELQNELLRLGRLDEVAFAEEIDGRYKKKTDLNRLAEANSIKPPKGAERSWLVRELRSAAVRVASHQLAR